MSDRSMFQNRQESVDRFGALLRDYQGSKKGLQQYPDRALQDLRYWGSFSISNQRRGVCHFASMARVQEAGDAFAQHSCSNSIPIRPYLPQIDLDLVAFIYDAILVVCFFFCRCGPVE